MSTDMFETLQPITDAEEAALVCEVPPAEPMTAEDIANLRAAAAFAIYALEIERAKNEAAELKALKKRRDCSAAGKKSADKRGKKAAKRKEIVMRKIRYVWALKPELSAEAVTEMTQGYIRGKEFDALGIPKIVFEKTNSERRYKAIGLKPRTVAKWAARYRRERRADFEKQKEKRRAECAAETVQAYNAVKCHKP